MNVERDVVLDSFALLAFFQGERGSEVIESYLYKARLNHCNLFMCQINAGEVFYMAVRKQGSQAALDIWKHLLNLPIELIPPDLELTLEAAKIKSTCKLSFADAHAAALAIRLKSILVTGDREFDSIKKFTDFKVKYII